MLSPLAAALAGLTVPAAPALAEALAGAGFGSTPAAKGVGFKDQGHGFKVIGFRVEGNVI